MCIRDRNIPATATGDATTGAAIHDPGSTEAAAASTDEADTNAQRSDVQSANQQEEEPEAREARGTHTGSVFGDALPRQPDSE
eukprot:11361543-Karenia_brevis.AAC.1